MPTYKVPDPTSGKTTRITGDSPHTMSELIYIFKSAGSDSEANDTIKREVVFTATQLRNSGVTVNDLSKYAVNSLEAQLGRISAPAKKAVEDVSKEIHGEVAAAYAKLQYDAQALVPETAATPIAIGERLRGHLKDAFNEFCTAEQTAWSDSKELPEYETVKVVPKHTQEWYDNYSQNTVQMKVATTDGVVTRPIDTGQEFGSAIAKLSSEQTLEQFCKFRSQVGESIYNYNALVRSDCEEMRLYKAVSTDIEDTLNGLPTGDLKTNLQKASSLSEKKYAFFKTSVWILKNLGLEGGSNPADIASKLDSPDAPSYLALLQKLVGPTRQAALNNDVGEYLLNQVGSAARDSVTGSVSVEKLLNNIDKLAPEIRTQFFPKYADVVALAKKEWALSKLDPKKILSNLYIDDPTLLHDALGAAPSAAVTAKIKDAFTKSKALNDQLCGTVLGSLSSGSGEDTLSAVKSNPERFVRSVMDGSVFGPGQTRKAMSLIASENPAIIQDLQFHYVDELLSHSAVEGRISASNLLRGLRGRSLREQADAILGPDKVARLEAALQTLGEIEKAPNPTVVSAGPADFRGASFGVRRLSVVLAALVGTVPAIFVFVAIADRDAGFALRIFAVGLIASALTWFAVRLVDWVIRGFKFPSGRVDA